MVYRYDCNGFFNQNRLGSYPLALPVPGILELCNYLQNVGAKTYIFGLQLSTFLFYNKQAEESIHYSSLRFINKQLFHRPPKMLIYIGLLRWL